ncbi:helix-turn-helix domain-containing protein [Microbacterium sp. NPDC087589]|uniref:helix-turn-helix domain-containing protein n=1 Tax=Microbacterium sp. NPDC087589 TaxID=3364191 RepID=UPI0037F44267
MSRPDSSKDVVVGERGVAVARNVLELRKQEGVGYAELSRRTDGRLADLALRRIERGQRRVDVDDLFLLARALDVSVDRLLALDLSYALGKTFHADTDDDAAEALADLREQDRMRHFVSRVVDAVAEYRKTDGNDQ